MFWAREIFISMIRYLLEEGGTPDWPSGMSVFLKLFWSSMLKKADSINRNWWQRCVRFLFYDVFICQVRREILNFSRKINFMWGTRSLPCLFLTLLTQVDLIKTQPQNSISLKC